MLVTIYQTYRGFMLQFILNAGAMSQLGHRVTLLCLADAFTYFVCASTGAYALMILNWLIEKSSASEPLNIPLVIFLVIYGLLGVTAKLPEILTKLQLPVIGK